MTSIRHYSFYIFKQKFFTFIICFLFNIFIFASIGFLARKNQKDSLYLASILICFLELLKDGISFYTKSGDMYNFLIITPSINPILMSLLLLVLSTIFLFLLLLDYLKLINEKERTYYKAYLTIKLIEKIRKHE